MRCVLVCVRPTSRGLLCFPNGALSPAVVGDCISAGLPSWMLEPLFFLFRLLSSFSRSVSLLAAALSSEALFSTVLPLLPVLSVSLFLFAGILSCLEYLLCGFQLSLFLETFTYLKHRRWSCPYLLLNATGNTGSAASESFLLLASG